MALAFLACVLAPGTALAQDGALAIDAGASYSMPPASSDANATPYLHAGARLEALFGAGGFAWLAGGGGLSLEDSTGSWLSGTAGVGTSIALSRRIFLDVSVAGEAFTVGDPYPYRGLLGEADAGLRLELGPLTTRVSAWGGAGGTESEVVGTLERRTRLGVVEYRRGDVVASDLWAWGGRLTASRDFGRVVPWVGVEAYDAPQGAYVGGRLGVRLETGGTAWDVEIGGWDTPDGGEVSLTARLALELGGGFGMRLHGGRYAPDPLLDVPVAGSAGAVMSWRVAGFGGTPPGEVPGPASSDAGRSRFTFEAPGARAVTIAGDFTDWVEVPMERTDGTWVVTLPVEPGVHRYAFRVDGAWTVPEGLPGGSRDEWGQPVATLVVPEP